MPYLTEDVKKAWVDAYAGDQVNIISNHGNVQVVELNGVRFSVRTELLSDSSVNKISRNNMPIEAEILPSKPRWKKKQTIVTQSLFN